MLQKNCSIGRERDRERERERESCPIGSLASCPMCVQEQMEETVHRERERKRERERERMNDRENEIDEHEWQVTKCVKRLSTGMLNNVIVKEYIYFFCIKD
jgi:hypothetical protein